MKSKVDKTVRTIENDFIFDSLGKALKDLFHPKILIFLLFVPLVALLIFFLGLSVFWSPLKEFFFNLINDTIFASALMWSFQWFSSDPVSIFAFVVGILVFLVMMPLGLLTMTIAFSVVTPIFILNRLHQRDFPQLKKYEQFSVVRSLGNSLKTSLIYLILLILSLPFFLFPPVFLILSHLLTSYLNTKIFSYDVFVEFLPEKKLKEIRKKYSGQLFSLGTIATLIYYVPILNIIGIAYIALAFTHFGLQVLNFELTEKNSATAKT